MDAFTHRGVGGTVYFVKWIYKYVRYCQMDKLKSGASTKTDGSNFGGASFLAQKNLGIRQNKPMTI